MRITCFTESLGGGGAEHQLVLLAELLSEKGYDVTIVTYASIPDHYDTPCGVKRCDIGRTRARNSIIRALIKAAKVFHYFFWLSTDVIIAYRECANLRVLPPMFFRSRKKVRVICSDRNTSLDLTFMHWLLLNVLYYRADYIVPNSKTETDIVASFKPKLIPKLVTIHNYTDLQQFRQCDMPTDDSLIRIAVFSRFSAQKNPIGFANALQSLKEKKTRPFQVHWFGSQGGDINGYCKEYLDLVKKIHELGLGDVFILHPSVKNPALEMSSFHAVCLPSLFEGFSNSVAEGICCGKPMIVSDVSDNSVMVHEGKNGFLFDPVSTESICDAFTKFFSLTYEDMCTMARCSRKIAESLFDKEQFIKQYITLFGQ